MFVSSPFEYLQQYAGDDYGVFDTYILQPYFKSKYGAGAIMTDLYSEIVFTRMFHYIPCFTKLEGASVAQWLARVRPEICRDPSVAGSSPATGALA
ncbi:hypothetical protein PoB_002692100 [Plakobranchus ocellatus]|uniref:Uncharacterized protein n=1 Tax=Plakobranchus ocellatus TaxID=259542 RepID=A0AAV3ZMU3_9GAST|nr:hypothetical protein PoB_002692100 [Plakobranchus ocellatus]